jgi:hypothetical protein
MKAKITEINYNKEIETKFGVFHQYYVRYNDKTATFLCKVKDKYPFKLNEENEFIETSKEHQGKIYYNIKAIQQNNGNSNYGKAVKKEQSKYSGFAVSYVKDLIIADKIKVEQWESASKKIFEFMVSLDKSIE